MMATKIAVTQEEYEGYLEAYKYQFGIMSGALTYSEYRQTIARLEYIYDLPWSLRNKDEMTRLERRVLA